MKKTLIIEPIFTDVSLLERIRIAADFGFDGVEFWDCAKDNARALGDEAAACGVAVTGCIAKGLFDGHLNRSYRDVEATFLESLKYMAELRCCSVLFFPGNINKHVDAQKCLIIENLRKLAPIAQDAGVTIYIEPINSIVNSIGHYLDSTQTAAEIVRCVDHEHVRMIFDIYHMQVMEGNIMQNIRDHADLIRHFHSAGVPGRNEHHLGELDYPRIIKCISDLGYDGYFGIEYFPSYDHRQSLRDVLAYLGI